MFLVAVEQPSLGGLGAGEVHYEIGAFDRHRIALDHVRSADQTVGRRIRLGGQGPAVLHGDDQVKGKHFLTLDEALEQKKVIVHETKSVNELAREAGVPQESNI